MFLFSEGREKFGEPLARLLVDDGLDEAVAALRAFALVDRETIPDERDSAITTEAIRLHRLVRTVAAERLQDNVAEAARRALIDAMATVYPRAFDSDPSAGPRARRLGALSRYIFQKDQTEGYGSFEQQKLIGFAAIRAMLEELVGTFEKELGAEDPLVARLLHLLARFSPEHQTAETYSLLNIAVSEVSLELLERGLGADSRNTKDSAFDLASRFDTLGRNSEAAAVRAKYGLAMGAAK